MPPTCDHLLVSRHCQVIPHHSTGRSSTSSTLPVPSQTSNCLETKQTGQPELSSPGVEGVPLQVSSSCHPASPPPQWLQTKVHMLYHYPALVLVSFSTSIETRVLASRVPWSTSELQSPLSVTHNSCHVLRYRPCLHPESSCQSSLLPW